MENRHVDLDGGSPTEAGHVRHRVSLITRVWSIARWLIVAIVMFEVLRITIDIVRGGPGAHNVPFDAWYGNWREVFASTALLLVFVLSFARPRRRGEWKSAGLYSAFLISLFTEMFGIPLTIYLLAPLVGLPVWTFGMNESHLWAVALDRLGLLPVGAGVYIVMLVSLTLIAVGLALVAVGWAFVYRSRDALTTRGPYRYVRHPQYLGLISIVIGFNIMWPTLPTLVMTPVLVIMYVGLAHREDEESATIFGESFLRYAARWNVALADGARHLTTWGRRTNDPVRSAQQCPARGDRRAARLCDAGARGDSAGGAG